MAQNDKKFHEVALQAGVKWAPKIPRKVGCVISTFNYGDEIASQSSVDLDKYVGLVISGEVEVYVESRLDDYIAYHPIRIIKRGELFGDFKAIDETVGDGFSTSENWRLVAGRRSVIILGKIDNRHVAAFSGEAGRAPHEFLEKNHSNEKIEIAFVKTTDLIADISDAAFPYVLSEAWPRMRSFRVGFNMYNLPSLLKFRLDLRDRGAKMAVASRKRRKALYTDLAQKHPNYFLPIKDGEKAAQPESPRIAPGFKEKVHEAIRKALKSEKKTLPVYVDQLYVGNLVPIFSDALYDALHRPISNSPVFAPDKIVLSERCAEECKNIKLDVSRILTACPAQEAGPVFYYPLDLNNYFINVISGEGIEIEAKDVFGWDYEADEALWTRARAFYCELANRLLSDEKVDIIKNHEYHITCEDVDALDKKILLLKFVKKKRKQEI